MAGVHPRTVQQAAARGEIPGAARMGRKWTFTVEGVGKWIEKGLIKPAAASVAKRPATRSGAATRSTAASASKARSGDGRYARAMSMLLAPASPKTLRG